MLKTSDKIAPWRAGLVGGDHPPQPRLTLNIGITGHRAKVLSEEIVSALSPKLDHVFSNLGDAAARLLQREVRLFADVPPQIRLHTPLASGADQVAAGSARANGFHVRALLPFVANEYRADFKPGKELADFERHLADADEVFALPGDRSDDESAYVMVGKAVVAASDILVAIWDGAEPNGRGGTAHVIDLALANSVPVIHLALHRGSDSVQQVRLLVGGSALNPRVERMRNSEDYDSLLAETLAPHTSTEREQFGEFLTEREYTANLRIEYPLLLSLLRIKSLAARPWRQSAIQSDLDRDWKEREDHETSPHDPDLAVAYAWANFLAIRYAQLFRSGHVANYLLSALAVLVALLGILMPDAKAFLVVVELAVIGLLFHNTNAGTSGDWHRKWLQYRHLAESLRPLLYLKQTGLINTPFRNDPIHAPVRRVASADWTRWYAAAVWRQLDSPQGMIASDSVRKMAQTVISEQILPQAHYHQVNAKRMHQLDHRLHEVGNFLMGAVIASCVLFLLGYVLLPGWIKGMTGPFIVLTAGVPAAGAAVFGIRGHGEHLLAASRSANTADALAANAARLDHATSLDAVAGELENTAKIMLADLNEWTVSYSERSLEIPA